MDALRALLERRVFLDPRWPGFLGGCFSSRAFDAASTFDISRLQAVVGRHADAAARLKDERQTRSFLERCLLMKEPHRKNAAKGLPDVFGTACFEDQWTFQREVDRLWRIPIIDFLPIPSDQRPLHSAAATAGEDAIRALLKKAPGLEASRDHLGRTALEVAQLYCNEAAVLALGAEFQKHAVSEVATLADFRACVDQMKPCIGRGLATIDASAILSTTKRLRFGAIPYPEALGFASSAPEAVAVNELQPHRISFGTQLESPSPVDLAQVPALYKRPVQTFIGRDVGANFHTHHGAINACALGRKLWGLTPPSRSLWRTESVHSEDSFYAQVTKANGVVCEQETGDMVYVPPFWGHMTFAPGVCVAVAQEFLPEKCIFF
eukprot:GEMP01055681.1.p1 GENE.GEMP01055681.1~~GEMP01055681.1.p1  ORF type:complete len:379 (+),score=96.19 GEMP01055681.1:30-1166(+)